SLVLYPAELRAHAGKRRARDIGGRASARNPCRLPVFAPNPRALAMHTRTIFALLWVLGLSGCASPGGPPPSLAPRAAEAIDPRAPVVRPINDRPVDAALARRLAELVSQARSGDSAFRGQAETAQRLAAAAGPPQSESWIAAQQALSAAIDARAPTTTALG